jgi:hypothetical protein
MTEWQPISTAPKDGTFFLAWFDKQEHHFLLWWFDGAWRFKGGTIKPVVGFTHWMALTRPPKGDE